jgi:NADPH2:quinone reductase
MKVIGVKKAGTAEEMKVVDIPNPLPQFNEVVIEQSFAAVNYGDVIRRKRGLFELGKHGYFIPGFEGVGRVVVVGNGVKRLKIGDRVSYLNGDQNGGYSQQICLKEQFAYKIPDSIPDETAAAMTCVGSAALSLTKLANIREGDWVIVHGASGGVGHTLVQLCMHKKAKVIAIVGAQEKSKFLERYSPSSIINRNETDIKTQIKNLTHGNGVTAIFDCVGKEVLDINMNCICKGGTILYYGSTSGHTDFPGMQILMNSLRIQGFNVFNAIQDSNEWNIITNKLISLVIDKKLEIHIDRILKMVEAPEAHKILEERHTMGKILLKIK